MCAFKRRKKIEWVGDKDGYDAKSMAGKAANRGCKLPFKQARSKGRSYVTAIYRFDFRSEHKADKRREVRNAMHILKTTFDGEFIEIVEEPLYDTNGKPILRNGKIVIPQFVEYWRIPIREGNTLNELRRIGNAYGIQFLYGTGKQGLNQGYINPIATGSGGDLPKRCFSAARNRMVYKENEKALGELTFLQFVYGDRPSLPITDANRLQHFGYNLFMSAQLPSMLDSLETLSQELIGQSLPKNWREHGEFWLDELNKWEKLEVFHARYVAEQKEKLFAEQKETSPEYAYWDVIQANIARWEMLKDGKTEIDKQGMPIPRLSGKLALIYLSRIGEIVPQIDKPEIRPELIAYLESVSDEPSKPLTIPDVPDEPKCIAWWNAALGIDLPLPPDKTEL